MKRFCAILVVATLVLGVAGSASARPPYKGIFEGKYLEGAGDKFKAAVGEAKCNVCHEGKEKKDRNEYGKALAKVLTKAKFDELKGDMDALKKFANESLEKTAGEKSSGGKTFGELIKAGELPGGTPK